MPANLELFTLLQQKEIDYDHHCFVKKEKRKGKKKSTLEAR